MEKLEKNPDTNEAKGVVGRCVLIVDDDRDFGAGLADLLKLEGYAVELAESAAGAEEVLKRFSAGVALIDIRLGKRSGIDLLANLQRRHPELLCVMMTAYADLDTAVGALRQGAYNYMRKPFHSEELLAILKRCFERIDIIREKAVAEAALQQAYNEMEEKVKERTRELEKKNKDLESFNKLFVDREFRIKDLRDRVKELESKDERMREEI